MTSCSPLAAPACAPANVRAHFHITAPAEPGLLPRVLEPLARLGHVPSRIHASREAGDGSELTIDLRLSCVPARTADLVTLALRALVGVRQVIAVIEPA